MLLQVLQCECWLGLGVLWRRDGLSRRNIGRVSFLWTWRSVDEGMHQLGPSDVRQTLWIDDMLVLRNQDSESTANCKLRFAPDRPWQNFRKDGTRDKSALCRAASCHSEPCLDVLLYLSLEPSYSAQMSGSVPGPHKAVRLAGAGGRGGMSRSEGGRMQTAECWHSGLLAFARSTTLPPLN